MDIEETVVRGKRFALDLEPVASERKIASGELAGAVGGERTVEAEGVAGEFDGCLEGKAVRAGDFEAHLSSVALRKKRKSEKEHAEVEQFRHSRRIFMLTVSKCEIELLRESSAREMRSYPIRQNSGALISLPGVVSGNRVFYKLET